MKIKRNIIYDQLEQLETKVPNYKTYASIFTLFE